MAKVTSKTEEKSSSGMFKSKKPKMKYKNAFYKTGKNASCEFSGPMIINKLDKQIFAKFDNIEKTLSAKGELVK